MPNTTTSQYMNLVLPIPTVEVGPQWAQELYAALNTNVDQHDHSAGQGRPVQPAGLDISSDLPFQDNNAVSLRSARFQSQVAPLSGPSDLDCVYVSGVDLYYNDGNGNQVRLTQSGSPAGSPGSITGLVAPASVSYDAGLGTFTFQSNVNTAANLDAAAITLRNTTVSSKGVTIQPHAALANDYSLVLPAALPGSVKILTVDSSGNVGDTYDVDGTSIAVTSSLLNVKTPAQLASPTTDTGTTAIGSSTPTTVSNLDMTFTATGRPVDFFLSMTSAASYAAGATGSATLLLVRGTTVVDVVSLGSTAGATSVNLAGRQVAFRDVPPAGSQTYHVQFVFGTWNTSSGSATLTALGN